jgi:hypothetical protein
MNRTTMITVLYVGMIWKYFPTLDNIDTLRIITGKSSDEIWTLTDSHKSYVPACPAQVGIQYKCEIYRPVHTRLIMPHKQRLILITR